MKIVLNSIQTEDSSSYDVQSTDEDAIINQALEIINKRMYSRIGKVTGTETAKQFVKLQLGLMESECFSVLFLDQKNQVIAFEKMFYGTIDSAAVYTRPVVCAVLKHNAASVIFAHNHPSGICTPSEADHHITRRLKDALNLIDVKVLDHLIVGESVLSFAEQDYI